MPKQFLDSTQIGAALKQVSGKGMAQRVWADPHARARGCHVSPDQAIDTPHSQPVYLDSSRRAGPPLSGHEASSRLGGSSGLRRGTR